MVLYQKATSLPVKPEFSMRLRRYTILCNYEYMQTKGYALLNLPSHLIFCFCIVLDLVQICTLLFCRKYLHISIRYCTEIQKGVGLLLPHSR